MFQFDLFNNPPTGNLSSPASTPADRRLCPERGRARNGAASEHREILPLSTATTKSIAVIGPDGTTDPADRRRRQLARHAVVRDQPAERHHRPRRLRGDGHVVFRHRSDPGCRRRPAGAGGDRVRELLGERRERPDEHLAAERPGRDDRGGRGRESQHDRRAEHRRTGADALAQQRQGRAGGVVPGAG